MHVDDLDLPVVQERMVASLDGDQCVMRGVLSCNKPRRRSAVAYAAHTQSLPLAERVIGNAGVRPDVAPFGRYDRTR